MFLLGVNLQWMRCFGSSNGETLPMNNFPQCVFVNYTATWDHCTKKRKKKSRHLFLTRFISFLLNGWIMWLLFVFSYDNIGVISRFIIGWTGVALFLAF